MNPSYVGKTLIPRELHNEDLSKKEGVTWDAV